MIAEFAEIVGLLCNFRQERGQDEALDHAKFLEWLHYHKHEELKSLIVNTAALRVEIDNLLRSEHSQMLGKLDQIEQILLTLMSGVDDFRGLALAIAPKAGLPDQAISILRQFVNSGGDTLFYKDFGGGQFILQTNGAENDGQVGVTEPHLIGDDFDQLLALRLLRVELNSDGDPLYHLTRNASRYIDAIDKDV
jgi:hypothetical protein